VFKSKAIWTVEIAVCKSIEEPETRDPVKTRRARLHTDSPNMQIQPNRRNPDVDQIHPKGAVIGSAETYRLGRPAAAEAAIIIAQDQFELGMERTTASIRQKRPRCRATFRDMQLDLHGRSAAHERPNNSRHQCPLQIHSGSS
jgi:hypothetical protein